MYDIQENYSAHSIPEVLELLNQNPHAVIVAGGTDVMIRMHHRKLCDATLIRILDIPEMKGISIRDDGALVIKAGTCFDDIYRHELIRQHVSLLSGASNEVGSPQIRHVATIGGNLCNGAVSADSVPSLLSLDAELELSSLDGVRTIPVTEFHAGPGKTVLRSDCELLTAIIISRENYENWGGCYLKFGQRNAMEISTLGCAATVKLDDRKTHIVGMRIAFGVAASKPVRCPKLEAAAIGMEVGQDLYRMIQSDVLAELNPRNSWRASKEFREQLICTQSVRAVNAAVIEAGGQGYDFS